VSAEWFSAAVARQGKGGTSRPPLSRTEDHLASSTVHTDFNDFPTGKFVGLTWQRLFRVGPRRLSELRRISHGRCRPSVGYGDVIHLAWLDEEVGIDAGCDDGAVQRDESSSWEVMIVCYR